MIMGIQYVFGENEVRFPVGLSPKPLIVLSYSESLPFDLAHQEENIQAYKAWLWLMLKACEQKGFYAIVQIPIQYLGVVHSTSTTVDNFLPTNRGSILAVYFRAGALHWFDYYLRLYYLLRKGLTYELVIDEEVLPDNGLYAETCRRAALCTSRTFVPCETIFRALWLGFVRRRKPFGVVVKSSTFFDKELRWKLYNRLLSLRRWSVRRMKASEHVLFQPVEKS